MVYLPFIGAATSACGTVVDRVVLKQKTMCPKLYQVSIFLGLVLIMTPLLYFFWRVDISALEPKNLGIFALVIAFSVVANILGFYAIKGEEVGNLVSAKALNPMFVILFALAFSFLIDSTLYERELGVVVPSIIAASAILASHFEKHHLSFNKYYVFAVLAGIFGALDLTVSRMILDYYSSLTFYFFRASGVFLLSLAIFRPNFKSLDKKSVRWIVFVSALWVASRVAIYSGYTSLGIVSTTLIVMLSPTLLYVLAYVFLREKVKMKQVVASAVVILCVAYVTFF